VWQAPELEGKWRFKNTWQQTYLKASLSKHKFHSKHPLRVQGFYSDLLYQPWHCTTVPLHSSWLKRDTRDRRTGLSVEEFKQQYELPNKPVILQNAVSTLSNCFWSFAIGLIYTRCLIGLLASKKLHATQVPAPRQALSPIAQDLESICIQGRWRCSHLAAAPLLTALFSASMTACWHQPCLCRRFHASRYAAVFSHCCMLLIHGFRCIALLAPLQQTLARCFWLPQAQQPEFTQSACHGLASFPAYTSDRAVKRCMWKPAVNIAGSAAGLSRPACLCSSAWHDSCLTADR